MPIPCATRLIRRAISPRLAISSFLNILCSSRKEGQTIRRRPGTQATFPRCGGCWDEGIHQLKADQMKILVVYARLYWESLRKAILGIRKNSWTLLLPIPLLPAFFLIGALLWPLGFVGGILMVFVRAALISCYLYFTGEVVSQSRVRISEFSPSICTYLWSVVNLG